jgi:anti-anti-sigma regulatory factor
MSPMAGTPERCAHFEILADVSINRARDLRWRVREALERGDRHVVIDCEAWKDLDVRMLSSLIRCASACRERGASLEVTNLRSQIKDELSALQLGHRLHAVAD